MASLLLFFFLFHIQLAASLETCQQFCSEGGPEVRFPFGLNGNRCNYPGFNLSCNDQGETILNLPRAGNFSVEYIDYDYQSIYIRESENCLPKRFLQSFDLSGSPFVPEFSRTFTFFNCSANSSSIAGLRRISCLSNENFAVVALPTNIYEQYYMASIPSSCVEISRTVPVPVMWPRASDSVTRLIWISPDCRACEENGGTCGFNDDSSFDIGCFDLPNRGLPRSAKYGIILGIGIPGTLFITVAACYICGRVRTYGQSPTQPGMELSRTVLPHPSVVVSGLDGPTIASYPKTLLGESRRLPKPNDSTCSICLCEYQAKEALRTLPECDHYYHADCIDEWLKMNATCPLCRNSPSPDLSSRATSSSSMSSPSFASSTP